MRTSDCDILIVPGHESSGPDHWQSRWERQLSTARRVEQENWNAPDRDKWVERIAQEVTRAKRPVVLVGHSLGVVAIAHAAPHLSLGRVQGAFLVGLPDVERPDFIPAVDRAFAPIPRNPLPFPSVLVASRTDPHCDYAKAEDIAYSWGSAFVDAGDAGHINTESGYGPWPEGLMRFAGFLKRLGESIARKTGFRFSAINDASIRGWSHGPESGSGPWLKCKAWRNAAREPTVAVPSGGSTEHDEKFMRRSLA